MKRDSCFNFYLSCHFYGSRLPVSLFQIFSFFFFFPFLWRRQFPFKKKKKKRKKKGGIQASEAIERVAFLVTPRSQWVFRLWRPRKHQLWHHRFRAWQEVNALLCFFSIFIHSRTFLRGLSSSVVRCVCSRLESNCNDTHRLSPFPPLYESRSRPAVYMRRRAGC